MGKTLIAKATPVATIVATVTLGLMFASAAMAQATVFGIWVTENELARIEIFDCGGQVCGKFVWFEEPNEEDGTPKVDDENPDEALQTRPLMGLQLLEGFDASGPTAWSGGTIYDPLSGNTYSSTMEMRDDNTLKVRGYVLLPILGRSQTWTRYLP
jgi:uncharacterized protein (DUF2147 family)